MTFPATSFWKSDTKSNDVIFCWRLSLVQRVRNKQMGTLFFVCLFVFKSLQVVTFSFRLPLINFCIFARDLNHTTFHHQKFTMGTDTGNFFGAFLYHPDVIRVALLAWNPTCNPGQNIWGRVKESSKTGKNRTTLVLVSDF